VRRREGTRFSSPSDDEVSGYKSAIRAERVISERSKQTRIARRCGEEEEGDTLFVPERRRSKRLQKRDPRGASD
jgi:hypothetical protein